MAEAVVGFLIMKIGQLLTPEAVKTVWALSMEELKMLTDVRKDMDDIKDELEMIRAFIREADQKMEMSGPKSVWVKQVRDIAYDVEDVIDEFTCFIVGEHRKRGIRGSVSIAVHRSRNLGTWHGIAHKLKDIKEKITNIAERRLRYDIKGIDEGSSSNSEGSDTLMIQTNLSQFAADDVDIIGMGFSKDILLTWLTDMDAECTRISVWGMGGLGKTTLVSQVYKMDRAKKYFECHAWVTVSQTYKADNLLKNIINDLFQEKGEATPLDSVHPMDTRRLGELIQEKLQDKRYVVVLDDVWSMEPWEKIRHAFPCNKCGSRIIFTTRNQETAFSLASPSRAFEVHPLKYEEAWALFCRKAFLTNPDRSCPDELKDSASAIVKKCDGLPLAIVTLGGVMYKKTSVFRWQNMDNSLNWVLADDQQVDKMKSILMLSFHDLPHYLKNCFLYCSIFPEDHMINRKRLIRLWVAEGYIQGRDGMTMEEVAEEYLNELVLRSMLQVVKMNEWGRVKECRMHDLVREVAISTSRTQNICTLYNGGVAWPGDRTRRLAIHKMSKNVKPSADLSHLRSLLLFAKGDHSLNIISNAMEKSTFKFLKVLELQGANITSIPKEVADLFNLSYLSLRHTKVRALPKHVGKLHNLQTLDLHHSDVEELPGEIIECHNLRHLFMLRRPNPGDVNFGMFTPKGIWELNHLQSLQGICSDKELVRHVKKLENLRSFGIFQVQHSEVTDLCESVSQMKFLNNLIIKAYDGGKGLLKLEGFHPSPLLQKLFLGGHLDGVPYWFQSLSNLKEINLVRSGLKEDPLPSLGLLPKLVSIQLYRACDGQRLCFNSRSFPALKKIWLYKLDMLNEIIIEKGAMQSIQDISLVTCKELKVLPQGIEHVSTLRTLYLEDMAEELLAKMRGPDHSKIKRIPIVRHVIRIDGSALQENLS
ncbi:Disease resistance protein RPM1 [Acorus calamus]|uniref:Disease resistance protein RPM1 n=1 Tax=Acorus calamus TaxID=4465 RepID=A0AAV9CRW8_ACOCL|nr:Disease resistance protein RPM1 [Acorus calamus]